MKAVVIILAVVLAVAVLLYFQGEQTKRLQARTLSITREQLTTFSNRAVAVEVEMVSLRTQLVARVAELEQTVTTVGADKVKAERRAKELQGRLETAEKDLLDEKAKLASVEDERTKVTTKLASVTGELSKVKGDLADLQKTQATREDELAALNAKKEALELERASLERRLNDLDELQSQIRLVKHRLWEQHIADWKRRDAEDGLGGNAGMLMKNGQWLK